MNLHAIHRGLLLALGVVITSASLAQCPPVVPAEGAVPPGPLPVFPADNWWNADVSAAPVDGSSSAFIAFINNGGTRKLHPDFGGEESPGSVNIYGMPYVVVDGTQAKQAVSFQYWDESDGVNYATGQGVPFYPIPAQAITQPHYVEGGTPGNVDQRNQGDRHLIILDCTNRNLYELYNVFYDATKAQWQAGSGAYFDLKTNARRPDTWTSADAAGLAIFPGLVRYDEAFNPAIGDIGHAFRVTVRSTNGYVFPASHRAGSTAGALPMGARLRLKKSVGGLDPALRTSDPNVQKIFRAMQKYGLIVADNGSDMYITGTFDTRWNNGLLNPAFATLSASDFEVVQLGWKPPAGAPGAAVSGISANPATVTGGAPSSGTVTLSAAAPSGGAVVSLSSASNAVAVPPTVTVAQGATTATFGITTSAVSTSTLATLSATYGGVTRTTTFTVNPATTAALSGVSASPSSVVGGAAVTGTVTLTAAAPAGGTTVSLSSNNAALSVAPSLLVPAGATSATFPIATSPVASVLTATITASSGAVSKTTGVTLNPVPAPVLNTLVANPASVVGGSPSTGTVSLSAAAPSGGTSVALSSNDGTVTVPLNVTVAAGATSASFTIATSAVASAITATVSATYNGNTKTATVTVNPSGSAPALAGLALNHFRVFAGATVIGTITLTSPAPAGGALVGLSSSNPSVASTPSSVVVAAGSKVATFSIATSASAKNTSATVSASYAGVTRSQSLIVMR